MTDAEPSSLFCFIPSDDWVAAVSAKASALLDAAGIPGRFLNVTVAQTAEWFMDEHGNLPDDINDRGSIRADYRVQSASGARFVTTSVIWRDAVEDGGPLMIDMIARTIADSVIVNLRIDITSDGAMIASPL